jgi:hypothetical protein
MKTSLINKNSVADVVASLLIFLFVFTAISKLLNIENFKVIISRSPLLHEVAGFVSFAVPITELVISLLLFLPHYRKGALLLSSILMAAFTLYIGYMLSFTPDLPCSCGGVIQQMTWPQHLIFNIVFFLLSLLAWKIKNNFNKDFIAINRQSRIPV